MQTEMEPPDFACAYILRNDVKGRNFAVGIYPKKGAHPPRCSGSKTAAPQKKLGIHLRERIGRHVRFVDRPHYVWSD
jgi:hypothetical protein